MANVLFGAFGQVQTGVGTVRRGRRSIGARDDRGRPTFARKVIVVPGYGMAVAQAQHDVRQLADVQGAVDVKYTAPGRRRTQAT